MSCKTIALILFHFLSIIILIESQNCLFDIYEKSNYDIYDPAVTLQYRTATCDCLSNILANSSDTSNACDKVICAAECATRKFNVVR